MLVAWAVELCILMRERYIWCSVAVGQLVLEQLSEINTSTVFDFCLGDILFVLQTAQGYSLSGPIPHLHLSVPSCWSVW